MHHLRVHQKLLNGYGGRFRNISVSVKLTFFGIAIHTGEVSRFKNINYNQYKEKQMQMHPRTQNETHCGCRMKSSKGSSQERDESNPM